MATIVFNGGHSLNNQTRGAEAMTTQEIHANNIPVVEQLVSPRSGRPIANQYIIYSKDYRVFQSYGSRIVAINKRTKQVYLDRTYWNYSKTTSKYRNIFLRETTKETEARIKSGEYILADLNL